jgi:hypothetical protein
LALFALGFITGIVVTYLYFELRSRKPAAPGKRTRRTSLPFNPPNPVKPATVDEIPPASPDSQEPPATLGTLIKTITPEPEPIKPVSLNPVSALLHSVPAATLKEKPKPQSMAMEIDLIMQELLPESPLDGHSIHLQEQPDHSLAVLVDLNRYDGLSQVSDPAVRQLIQAAVTEWQRRATRNP